MTPAYLQAEHDGCYQDTPALIGIATRPGQERFEGADMTTERLEAWQLLTAAVPRDLCNTSGDNNASSVKHNVLIGDILPQIQV